MKKYIFSLAVMMVTMLTSANAMSYEQAREQALFLTDKMAYELNLSEQQYEAAYEINLDYLLTVNTYDDVYAVGWTRRDLDFSYILADWQYRLFREATYFYRPLFWEAGAWHFGIYARYPHRDYFYFGHPHFYTTYRGGHAWHMHGGHSWYHTNFHHVARPANVHSGMRDGWNRGSYRGNGRSDYRNPQVTTGGQAGSRGGSNGSYGRPSRVGGGATDGRVEGGRESSTRVTGGQSSPTRVGGGQSSPTRVGGGASTPTRVGGGQSSPTRVGGGQSSPTRSGGSYSGSGSRGGSYSGGASRGGGVNGSRGGGGRR